MSNKSPFGSASHFANMGSWKAGRPKNLIETSLWQAWVAWIEEGQQIVGTEYLRRKIIRIHHWFTTQTSTLTMFELDCASRLNISPFPTLWYSHELNVFARKNRGNGFLKPTNMSHKFPFGNASHLENIDSWKAGSPTSNPLRLKAQSRQWFIGLHQSHVTTESAINIL